MNVRAFLYLPSYQDTIGVSTAGNDNTWLKDLNSGSVIYVAPETRMSNDGTGGKVHVGLFVGMNTDSTIDQIMVGPPKDIYQDGRPTSPQKNSPIFGDGDGTVPYDSAVWPAVQMWTELRRVAPGEHSELVKVFSEDIKNFLIGDAQQGFAIQSSRTQVAAAETATSELFLSI